MAMVPVGSDDGWKRKAAVDAWAFSKVRIPEWQDEERRDLFMTVEIQRYLDIWAHVPGLGNLLLAEARRIWPEWAVAVIEGMQPLTPGERRRT